MAPSNKQTTENALNDAEFLAEVLESLPGVDTTDPRFESMLQGTKKADDPEKKPEEKDDEKK